MQCCFLRWREGGSWIWEVWSGETFPEFSFPGNDLMEHKLNIWNSFVKTHKGLFKKARAGKMHIRGWWLPTGETHKGVTFTGSFTLVHHKSKQIQMSYLTEAGLFLWKLSLSRKTSNQAFNRHTPPFTVGPTTKVRIGLRYIQILKFWGWERKATNTRMSHSTH